MTQDEVIQRLKNVPNRAAVSRATGLPYHYICHLVRDEIADPGSSKIDKLRSYFLTLDITNGRPQ